MSRPICILADKLRGVCAVLEFADGGMCFLPCLTWPPPTWPIHALRNPAHSRSYYPVAEAGVNYWRRRLAQALKLPPTSQRCQDSHRACLIMFQCHTDRSKLDFTSRRTSPRSDSPLKTINSIWDCVETCWIICKCCRACRVNCLLWFLFAGSCHRWRHVWLRQFVRILWSRRVHSMRCDWV